MQRNKPDQGLSPALRTVRPTVFALALGMALGIGPLHAMEKGTFKPPDLNAFVVVSSDDEDGDGDGVKETHVVHYQDRAGDKLFSMTTKGRLWAWSLKTSGDPAPNSAWNYVIRDSNCDGVFDEKYGLDEEFHVPDCLK